MAIFYEVLVDDMVEFGSKDIDEATARYRHELTEAMEGEEVVLRRRITRYTTVDSGVGTIPWPPYDPNARAVPIALPTVTAVRGGIQYQRGAGVVAD